MIGWVDIETTGLDASTDEMLEIALIITDDQLEELDRFHYIMHSPSAGLMLDPFVLDMHTKNSLLLDCMSSWNRPQQVGNALVERLDKMPKVEFGQMVMGGSTINFDRSFLQRWMPKLEKFFHYRNIDVSTLRRCAQMWRPELATPAGRDLHRAVPDIEDSIELARYYRHFIYREGIA